jgi:hypothetical protein
MDLILPIFDDEKVSPQAVHQSRHFGSTLVREMLQ